MKSVKRLDGIVLSCVLFAVLMPGYVYAEGGDGKERRFLYRLFRIWICR